MLISIGTRSIPKITAVTRAFSRYPELWINSEDKIEYLIPKQQKKYNIILYLALIPIIILLIYSLYSMIFGIDFFNTVEHGPTAFIITISVWGLEFWPLWIIDILIIIFCLIKLKKKKTSN